jgi:hypothetical protein
MEVAGLAVGIAGLAGLFSPVPDAPVKIDSYRKFGSESRFVVARLNLDKALFKAWAERVGLTGDALRAERHPKLADPAITLLCMEERFGLIETALKRPRRPGAKRQLLEPMQRQNGHPHLGARTRQSCCEQRCAGKRSWLGRGCAKPDIHLSSTSLGCSMKNDAR